MLIDFNCYQVVSFLFLHKLYQTTSRASSLSITIRNILSSASNRSKKSLEFCTYSKQYCLMSDVKIAIFSSMSRFLFQSNFPAGCRETDRSSCAEPAHISVESIVESNIVPRAAALSRATFLHEIIFSYHVQWS